MIIISPVWPVKQISVICPLQLLITEFIGGMLFHGCSSFSLSYIKEAEGSNKKYLRLDWPLAWLPFSIHSGLCPMVFTVCTFVHSLKNNITLLSVEVCLVSLVTFNQQAINDIQLVLLNMVCFKCIDEYAPSFMWRKCTNVPVIPQR